MNDANIEFSDLTVQITLDQYLERRRRDSDAWAQEISVHLHGSRQLWRWSRVKDGTGPTGIAVIDGKLIVQSWLVSVVM